MTMTFRYMKSNFSERARYSDKSTDGVGIEISPDAIKCLVDFKPISNRVISQQAYLEEKES